MTLTESLQIEMNELIQMYGLVAVKRAFDKAEDAAKERSIATLDNGRAWPQADNE